MSKSTPSNLHNRETGGAEGHGSAVDTDEDEDAIVVRSPQFTNAVWEYGIERCRDGGGVRVSQKGEG